MSVTFWCKSSYFQLCPVSGFFLVFGSLLLWLHVCTLYSFSHFPAISLVLSVHVPLTADIHSAYYTQTRPPVLKSLSFYCCSHPGSCLGSSSPISCFHFFIKTSTHTCKLVCSTVCWVDLHLDFFNVHKTYIKWKVVSDRSLKT